MAKKKEPIKGQENLIPFSERTEEEQRKIAQAGGIASGKARRERKTLREELLALLSDGDTQQRVSLALINEALNGNNAGSVKGAFETIRDTIGEKAAEKLDMDTSVTFKFVPPGGGVTEDELMG